MAWPNPTHGQFFVQLDGKAEGKVSYRIVAVNGQLITVAERADERLECDLSGHSAGIYYLQTSQGGKTWTQEVLLQR